MISIEFSVPTAYIISANGREHHMKIAGKSKKLRYDAGWHATQARRQWPGIGVLMEQATLDVFVGWQPLKRRRDTLNLGPTLKPIIDGIVDAKVLRDDDSTHLLKTTWQTYERSEPGVVWIRLEFSDAS